MVFLSIPSLVIAWLAIVTTSILFWHLRNTKSQPTRHPLQFSEPNGLAKALVTALPDVVLLPGDTSAFDRHAHSYWAQQECEVVPACIVRPRNAYQLGVAVSILRHEYQRRKEKDIPDETLELFAIRSGGHSAVHGAASIEGGALLDLGLLNEVICSEDDSVVFIGAGARWGDVSNVLDKRGLAVTGGRNSDVGVGGLALGGGLSFLTPRLGLVCSNVLSYKVLLASGSLVTASAATNQDLWRALKGGSNNFGIVTQFTLQTVPLSNIWSGFLYMPSSQADKVLAAFFDCLDGSSRSSCSGIPYNVHAAGPMACFTFIGALQLQAISVHLAHTGSPLTGNGWPTFWKTSSFATIWRLWSTLRVRTMTNATDELKTLNPPGKRQMLATTTIKNSLATLHAAHTAYLTAVSSVRSRRVKGVSWTLVLQPLLPTWACKGDSNPLGFSDSDIEPLVIVSFTVNWSRSCDDDFVKDAIVHAINAIDSAAEANNTAHPYRYLNYCADWQKPFESYGADNLAFLQRVSTKYDPERLFQNACTGGFKLFDNVDKAEDEFDSAVH